jgi:hypothetical protein
MSHKDKLSSALALIQTHNNAIEDKADHVDPDVFQKKLKALGGTTEEALQECTWEDLENCGLPRILARKVATIFRAAAKIDPEYVSPKKASAMAALYLIQQYNPDEPDSVIAKELNTRVNGKKFVVFNSGGSVNVEKTSELYNEIQKRWPERDFIEIDGLARRVFRVGEGKTDLADESPIYSGRALRPDGTDDQLGRSWDGVSQSIRQLIYVAVNHTGEIGRTNKEAHDTLDMALLADGEKKLRQRCQKATVLLQELIEQGNAPKLKINRVSASNARSDPFFQANNRTY